MGLRSLAPWFVGLLVASSLGGCGSADQSEDAEFDADWVEDFENDLAEDAAEETEQAELDELDDMDDVEVLDEESDTATASLTTKATKKAAPKRAPHGPLSIIEEDPWFSGEQWVGPDARNYDVAAATARVAEARAIGADVVRVMLWWSAVAPGSRELKKPSGFVASKPDGYDWRYLDAQIEAARANGLKVLITATAGNMPYWASEQPSKCRELIDARKSWSCSWKPDPKEYAKFVTAVGRHVKAKGYRIWAWTFVNEPNIGGFLNDADTRIDRDKNAAMEIAFRYRRLWFAARKHLRATARVRARVLWFDGANNQKTKGETLEPSSGRWNLIPWSLCLQTEWNPDLLDGKYKCPLRPRKAHVHGVAFHPYASSASQAITSVNFLQKLVDDAAQEGRITRSRGLYMTESAFLTAKGKGSTALGAGNIVTPAAQAVALNEFERAMYKNKRVKSFSQYELIDEGRGSWDCGLRFAFGDVHRTDGSTVSGDFREVVLGSHVLVGSTRVEWAQIAAAPWDADAKWFQRTGAGAEKPAYAAYKLGIDVEKSGDEVTVWGHSRADSGAGFSIEGLYPSGEWHELTTVKTDAFGFGQKTIKIGTATAWRLRFGADVSRVAR